MAMFRIRLSRLHEGLPKSIAFMTHLLFSSSQGFRSGKARSNRNMKKETSIRNPMPAPTAMSSTIEENEKAPPIVEGFDFNSQTFPASVNTAPLKKRYIVKRYSALISIFTYQPNCKNPMLSLSWLYVPGPTELMLNARMLLGPPLKNCLV